MKRPIYKLAEEDYAALAAEIKGRLQTPCYFTGTVESIGAGGESLRLTASLILYRRRVADSAQYDAHDTIYDVASVWWDFLCEDEEGVIADDFDYNKLLNHLIEE